MTRFDAAEPTERRRLFADGVTAHRERASGFCTFEVDPDSDTSGAEEGPPPWIQFAERLFNLDCTDAELDRLKSLLSEFPEFRIDELNSPEDAAATNVTISARSDANRLAGFIERAFREVYELAEDYRVWAADV